ncbi:MAG: transposase [Pseudomonadota bacterium]
MQYIGECRHVLYTDESNVNLFLRHSRGRFFRARYPSTRAVVRMPSSKGANKHMIGAISQMGIVQFDRKRGSFTKDLFAEWMRNLLQKVVDGGTLARNIVVVIDNAPCHSGIESVFAEFPGSQVLRLAPYSPMLNSIEGCWG